MDIKSLLAPERTLAKVSVNSKKRVLESLAKLFSETIEDFDEIEVYQHLLNRERLGSTGIGNGIGIPHCRFHAANETYGACITLADPVDFESVDSTPVDIVFAMLVPENAESNHLEALASLAEVLQKPEFVKKLRSAKDSDDLYKFMVTTAV